MASTDIRDRSFRSEQFHMLLATTYGLNNSHTKRIHVGLQTTKDGVFVPVVKLTGNHADGIYFDAKSWRLLQDYAVLMSGYLSGDNKLKPIPVTVDNVTVNFTTAYGARSILLAYKENEEHSVENTEKSKAKETTDSSPPPSKKRKTYDTGIVMQQTTFLGLLNIVKCVDAHLNHLQLLAGNVNDCVQYLISEIELNLPKNYVDRDIVKLALKGNFDDIERNVRTQIKDLTFLDSYFNIIFSELTALRFNEIFRKILTKRGTLFS